VGSNLKGQDMLTIRKRGRSSISLLLAVALVLLASVLLQAQGQSLADAITILPPSFDPGENSWTVVFRNTSERQITGFAADLVCTHSNGASSPLPIEVDLAPALAWAVILKNSPDHDKVVSFKPGELYSYSFPGIDVRSVEGAVKGVVFIDDTAVGDDKRIQRVFDMRTDLATRKGVILSALYALNSSPASQRTLRPNMEKLPEGSPLRREMERVEVHLAGDGDIGLANALSIYEAESSTLKSHMIRRFK